MKACSENVKRVNFRNTEELVTFFGDVENHKNEANTLKKSPSKISILKEKIPTKQSQVSTNSELPESVLEDIVTYFLQFQVCNIFIKNNSICKDGYLEAQADITISVRAILIDWIVEVHSALRLKTQCLFLAILLVDKFLEKEQVSKSEFQLLGISCL